MEVVVVDQVGEVAAWHKSLSENHVKAATEHLPGGVCIPIGVGTEIIASFHRQIIYRSRKTRN